jgi:hypothetical protein
MEFAKIFELLQENSTSIVLVGIVIFCAYKFLEKMGQIFEKILENMLKKGKFKFEYDGQVTNNEKDANHING